MTEVPETPVRPPKDPIPGLRLNLATQLARLRAQVLVMESTLAGLQPGDSWVPANSVTPEPTHRYAGRVSYQHNERLVHSAPGVFMWTPTSGWVSMPTGTPVSAYASDITFEVWAPSPS